MLNKDQKKQVVVLSSLAALYCLSADEVSAMGGGGGCVTGNIAITAVVTPLNYASLSACVGVSGQLDLDPKGTLSTTGCITGTSGTVQVARVRVRGNQAASADKVVIRAPSGVVGITDAGNTMNVTTFDWSKKGQGPTHTINGNATTTLSLGAVLNVAGSQPGGNYSGVATISATCL